jgi:NADH-quinone oxidoreductase subunit C
MAGQLDTSQILQKLRAYDSSAIADIREFRGELTVYVPKERLQTTCGFLRDTPGLAFKYLSDLTAVDCYPNEPRFEVVYHLLSLESLQRLRLKVRLSGDNPNIASVVPVWPAANAFEREVFDLFGIRFDGHPFLRRILLPEDWEGYPLRKDYPTTGYR